MEKAFSQSFRSFILHAAEFSGSRASFSCFSLRCPHVTMGIVLGRVTVETAQYEVLRQTKDYEIRKYAPCVVAEVQASELYEAGERWSPSQFNTDAFRLLAGGSESVAMTAPVTSTPEPMAMTAPVTSAPEQVAMTAPVQSAPTSARQGESLAFVLPRKYQKWQHRLATLRARGQAVLRTARGRVAADGWPAQGARRGPVDARPLQPSLDDPVDEAERDSHRAGW
eukprot:ctg_12.g14